ncbi:MAG: hypothetical protein HPY76_07530 [Anaerolineae bacterium]|nr:hypothetical protein [Anaerolineae bacterium]
MNKHNPMDNDIDPRQGFQALADVPQRDPALAAQGKAAFLTSAREISRTVSQSANSRHKEWMNPISLIFGKEPILKMNKLGIALIMVFVLLAGTGVTVYASQSSLPGDLLYPVKLASEDTAALISNEPADAMSLNLKLADRRMTEYILLQGEGEIPPETLPLALENRLELAFKAASQLDDPALASAQLRLEQQVRSQLERLTTLNAPHDPQALAELTRLQDRLQERLYLAELPADQFRTQLKLQLQDREAIRLHLTETPQAGGGYGPGALVTEQPGETGGYGAGGSLENTPGSGDGYGPGPYITGTPTPGSSYGPGPGLTGTPIPGGPYGPGPEDPPGDGYGPGDGGQPEEPHKGNGN